MHKLTYLVLIILLINIKIVAQTVEPSTGVEKNNIQLEFETLFSIEKKESQKNTSWSLPNILVRYGISKNIELQLHTPFTKERCFENNLLTSNVFKFDEVEIGVSLNLWKQHKILPETAIMARVISKTNRFSINKLGNIISLNFSNIISKKISLGYNIGTSTNINKETTGFYILNVTYVPNSNWHYFLENSRNFTFENTESNCLGTGFGHNLNSNITIDFSFSKSLKNNMFYTGAILSWAINTKKS